MMAALDGGETRDRDLGGEIFGVGEVDDLAGNRGVDFDGPRVVAQSGDIVPAVAEHEANREKREMPGGDVGQRVERDDEDEFVRRRRGRGQKRSGTW